MSAVNDLIDNRQMLLPLPKPTTPMLRLIVNNAAVPTRAKVILERCSEQGKYLDNQLTLFPDWVHEVVMARTIMIDVKRDLSLTASEKHKRRKNLSEKLRRFNIMADSILKTSQKNVVYTVSKTDYVTLNRHFPSFISNNKKLLRLAGVLAKCRKFRLGDIAKLTYLELLRYADGDRDTLSRLMAELASANLQLASAIPKWRSTGPLLCCDW